MINLIMPMAGGGIRFKDKNFAYPKPLIEIHEKPFFYWAAQSVLRNCSVKQMVFAVLREHETQFGISDEIKKYYPEAQVVILDKLLNGAVLTCREAAKVIDNDLPIVFNDCDHLFNCAAFADFCARENYSVNDGMLLTFKSDEDKFSFVRYDSEGNFAGTVEKEVVSNDAICGVYCFRNKDIFFDYSEKYLTRCSYKEFFMSGVYNVMCDDNRKIDILTTDFHLSFGTPDEYDAAITNSVFKDF